MKNPFKEIEKEKTIADHFTIIQTYRQTGFLDREKAIMQYKNFNKTHPDYYIQKATSAILTNNSINIENGSTDQIVENLLSQLLWICSEDDLKKIGFHY